MKKSITHRTPEPSVTPLTQAVGSRRRARPASSRILWIIIMGWKGLIWLNTSRSSFLQVTIWMIFWDKHFSLHMECKRNAAQMSVGYCINAAGWEQKSKIKTGESLMAWSWDAQVEQRPQRNCDFLDTDLSQKDGQKPVFQHMCLCRGHHAIRLDCSKASWASSSCLSLLSRLAHPAFL